MNPAHFRRGIIEALIARLLPLPPARACFEGGSAATGRVDEYSDIDLVVVAPLAAGEAIFEAIEGALSERTRITHTWRVDPAPFPETAQRFYLLAGAPPFFAVDCVVVTETGVAQFLERERHGDALVYFDRTGKIRARPLDQRDFAQRRSRRWTQLQGAVPVYAMLVEKELARGRPLEALGFYQALLRALLEVLGMAHRPDRFDFGWRYVETQLPEDAQALLRHFAFVADGEVLRERAAALADELRRRLAHPPDTPS